MKKINVHSDKLERCAEVFKIMAHPIRLSIAIALYHHDTLNVGSIQDLLQLSQSIISQHIAKMREAGIIVAKRQGTKIYYSLKDTTAVQLIACIQQDI